MKKKKIFLFFLSCYFCLRVNKSSFFLFTLFICSFIWMLKVAAMWPKEKTLLELCSLHAVSRLRQRQRGDSAAVRQWRPQQLSAVGSLRRHSQAGVRAGQGGEEVTERAGNKPQGCTVGLQWDTQVRGHTHLYWTKPKKHWELHRELILIRNWIQKKKKKEKKSTQQVFCCCYFVACLVRTNIWKSQKHQCWCCHFVLNSLYLQQPHEQVAKMWNRSRANTVMSLVKIEPAWHSNSNKWKWCFFCLVLFLFFV